MIPAFKTFKHIFKVEILLLLIKLKPQIALIFFIILL
jgi:hypothetical protein